MRAASSDNASMSQHDFTVETLAAYLHLAPAQVARLAERELLPARKVSGEWRFSGADVHHWLESRLGLMEDSTLTHVEKVLEESAPSGEEPVSIAQLLPVAAIATPLAARTRRSVIDLMCQLAANTGLLWDAAAMGQAVLAREEMQPTAMESGVALLHARRPMSNILAEPLVALGVSTQGIAFGGARGMLTDIFFLICSVDDRGHLRTLAKLSRLISDASLLQELRSASDGAAAHRSITQRETQLDG
jgi:PTS system nitrogen regulatory IIA component